ncbi:MAG: glycosyltransferase, partial [Bacteroidales bacterium]|nr:glycosyltransferase [Bacteroidales bacterium]
LRNSLQEFVNQNLLKDIVTFHGQVPRTKAVEMFDKAHLHVITSASEGNPTTIWEAMSYGVPTLSFDHCGMHDTLRDGAGILIPIKPKYEDNVLSISRAIEDLINNSFKLKELADVTLARANEYTWAKRVELLNRIYSNICK